MRLLAILLLVLCWPAEAKQKRDPQTKAAFVRNAPGGACPVTGARRLPCPGWEVHHIVPLYCGGMDEVANMVWLSTDQHRALHRATDCRKRS